MKNAQNIAQDMVAEKRRSRLRDIVFRLVLLGLILSMAALLALAAVGMWVVVSGWLW